MNTSDVPKVPGVPADLQPTRIDKDTVEFLGIQFKTAPAPPKPKAVAKPSRLAKVQLVGQDSNAYMLIGLCLRAGRAAGYSKEQLECFKEQAQSGDYNNVLTTCCEWFEVE